MPLETNSVAESDADGGARLGTVLAGYEARDVLMAGELQTATAADGTCGKATDLVRLGEILAAHGVEEIRGKPRLEGKTEARRTGHLPASGAI